LYSESSSINISSRSPAEFSKILAVPFVPVIAFFLALFVAVINGILPRVHTFKKWETQFIKWGSHSTYKKNEQGTKVLSKTKMTYKLYYGTE
jgi:hypothetical protein